MLVRAALNCAAPFLSACSEIKPWLHIPAVLWSSVVNLKSWTCPLTPLEKLLRTRAGLSGYAGGFVQHYVGRAVYPRGMPRRLELVAGISILVGNLVAYAAILALE